MAVLSLPLSFTNSFWSQDYRRGLEVLFEKLEQGVAENDEIIAFIRARALAERQLASSLTNPSLTGPAGTGFGADDGASLLMAFRGLQAESVAQGQAHHSISKELDTLVADPFDEWAQGYKERLKQTRYTVIDNWLRAYEHAQGDVSKLKHQYLAKTRRADEAEDDAKFAPNNEIGDKYTTSPRVRPADRRAPPQRTPSVSERIALRLKEIQRKSADALSGTTESEPKIEEDDAPKIDKGKGKAVDIETTPASPPQLASPPPLSPPLPPSKLSVDANVHPGLSTSPMPPMPPSPLLLAGLSLPPVAISQLLTRAASELPLRPVRFPLLGEYQDCFTGEEFVAWLTENVQGFGGSLDRAEDAARELTEREGLLRRIGEFGNLFEGTDVAFYQFRPKAFDADWKGHQDNHSVSSPVRGAKPVAENLIKRTGTFVNLVTKALNNQANNSEPGYVKARHDAENADKTYRVAVRKLDRQRLGLEERIEDTLKMMQRWEIERLRAVKTVLLQYQGTLANLPKTLEPSIERSATLIAAYQPESDLTALIERYRTGPFRPDAQVYESVSHDESDVVFGIDLRKWAEGGWNALTSGEEKKEVIPPVVTALLDALKVAYEKLPDDAEKRKSWIYEVPLPAVHHLREALNALPADQPIPRDLIAKYDAPVIASTVKLWTLELDPPLALYEGWEDFRRLYPTMGAAKAEDNSEEQHIQDLGAALQRLPRVHLYVLDAIVGHLKSLIDSTTVEEPNEVYITKLALSVGRTIIRPKFESEISIQDRHPTLLFIDLVKNYAALLPPTIVRKKRESERKVPIRKRTAPVDMRLSRSRISLGADAKQLLAAQAALQNPSLGAKIKSPEIFAPQPLPAVGVIQRTSSPPSPPQPQPSEPPAEVTPPAVPVAPVELVEPTPEPVAAVVEPEVVEPDPHAPPPRPSFREPPPEDDDLPPRPTFKEPPPEHDEHSPPPMPKFVDPPPEEAEIPSPSGATTFAEPEPEPTPAPAVPSPVVTPPTPQPRTNVRRMSAALAGSRSSSPTKAGSRSGSASSNGGNGASNEDRPISSARASISRSGSNQGTGVTRSPRMSARGPRPPSGTVGNLVQNINRNSVSGSPSPPGSGSPSPTYKRLSGGRPGSLVGRSSAFSRRTMASDAEDDIVERK